MEMKWYNESVKNYASRRAGKGRVAYRTPSRFLAEHAMYGKWDRAARPQRVPRKRRR